MNLNICKGHEKSPPRGRYNVDKEIIGAGEEAEVYKGYDTKLEKQVAFKKIILNDEITLEDVERNLRVLKFVSKVCPEYMAQLYDWYCLPHQVIIVLELIDGLSFKRLRETGGLNKENEGEIFIKTANAIRCLHKHNIIHGDIHEGNIMIAKNGDVKIIDYGGAYISKDTSRDRLEMKEDIWSLGRLMRFFGSKKFKKLGKAIQKAKNKDIENCINLLYLQVYEKQIRELADKYEESEQNIYECIKKTSKSHSQDFAQVLSLLH